MVRAWERQREKRVLLRETVQKRVVRLQLLEHDLGLAGAPHDDRPRGRLLVGREEVEAVRGLGAAALDHVPVDVEPRNSLVLGRIAAVPVLVDADLDLTAVHTGQRSVPRSKIEEVELDPADLGHPVFLALEVAESREELGVELHDGDEFEATVALRVLGLPDPPRRALGRDGTRGRSGLDAAAGAVDLDPALRDPTFHVLQPLPFPPRAVAVRAVVARQVDDRVARAAEVAAAVADDLPWVDGGVRHGVVCPAQFVDLRREGGDSVNDVGGESVRTALSRSCGEASVAVHHPPPHGGGELDGPGENEEGKRVLIVDVLQEVGGRLLARALREGDDDVGNLGTVQPLGEAHEGDLRGRIMDHARHLDTHLLTDERLKVRVIGGLGGPEHDQALVGELVRVFGVLEERPFRRLIEGDDH